MKPHETPKLYPSIAALFKGSKFWTILQVRRSPLEQAKPCNLLSQVFGPGIPHCSRGNDIDPRLGFHAIVLDARDSVSCRASS